MTHVTGQECGCRKSHHPVPDGREENVNKQVPSSTGERDGDGLNGSEHWGCASAFTMAVSHALASQGMSRVTTGNVRIR